MGALVSGTWVGVTQLLTFLFFFQAEDGIRDVAVTGVQTCALPICHWRDLRRGLPLGANRANGLRSEMLVQRGHTDKFAIANHRDARHGFGWLCVQREIGRASCRERV